MALIPRLEQRQSQTLVMTPQLQQAIKLLQLSNLELMEYVEKELETNPMLEREEETHDREYERSDTQEERFNLDDLESVEPLSDINFNSPIPAEIQDSRELDAEGDNTYTNDSETDLKANSFDMTSSHSSSDGQNSKADSFSRNIEQTLPVNTSLREHLNEQLRVDFPNSSERLIGAYLIDLIDETGWMTEELDTIANTLGCDTCTIASILERLQQFDPPGIFARNLSECLELQLKDLNRFDPCMDALLQNLDLLAQKKLSELGIVCGVNNEDLNQMLTEIRALNPKPGSLFENCLSQPIVPDIIIRGKRKGDWIIELNSETLPRVLVNNEYYSQVASLATSKDDKLYISQQFQSANWLIKALHQRATTTLKVMTELVRQQNEFFEKGVNYLKPLVLHNIAEAIEMHESTVSRVTSNKYVATPRGIFELKYFFTTAIASTNGSTLYSAESIRHKIKTLINGEPAKKILSDDKIVTLLKKEGVNIARRTVAKYRESMNIPSSVERRREKSLPL